MEMAQTQQTQTAQAAAQVVGNNGNGKMEVLFNAESHVWQVQRKNKDGSTVIVDKEESFDAMGEDDAIRVYLAHSKDAPKKRWAATTLLATILTQFYESHLSAWQGTGDRQKPIPSELSAQFRSCEEKYFERFLDAKHPSFEVFVSALPTTDMRGHELLTNGKLNRPAQFQAFLTAMRKEPTYNNTKNTVLGFFSYLGKLPMGDDGRLIPPEVMAVMVRNARINTPVDNSYKAKLSLLYRVLVSDSDEGQDKPTDEDLPAIIAMLEQMLDKAKSEEVAAAGRAAQRVKPGDVAKLAGEAISDAKQGEGYKVVH
jgi:hypothetical protein